jgi:hypothetical protein
MMPLGNFARDARALIRIRKKPVIRKKKRLKHYLIKAGACPEFLAIVQRIWTEFASTAKPKKNKNSKSTA